MPDSKEEAPRREPPRWPPRSFKAASWTAIIGIPILLAAEILDSTEYFEIARDLFGLLGPDKVELTPDQLKQLAEEVDRTIALRLTELSREIESLRADVNSVLAAVQARSSMPDQGAPKHSDIETVPGRRSAASGPIGQGGFEPIAWVQLGDDGKWIARAIFGERTTCPQIMVDGQAYQMFDRRTFAERQFPILVCEFRLRAGERASIAELELPVPASEAKSILLFGDTGCRLTHYAWQGCLDRDGWPFRSLLDAAEQHDDVDLIIHVGDYHYREKPCVGQRPQCAGSSWGDTWAAWRQDFFEPAREALLRAPWIMLRGNHEDCARAGAGWHHFLSPTMSERAPQDRCREFTEPYQLALTGEQTLVILDTAHGTGKLYGDDASRYERWQDQTQKTIGNIEGELWLLLHQPLRTLPRTDDPSEPCDRKKRACPFDEVKDALAARQPEGRHGGPRNIVIAGDTHMFQYVVGPDRGERAFIQVVAGMGGTSLDSPGEFVGFAEGSQRTEFRREDGAYYTALARHGFLLLSSDQDNRWQAEIRAIDDDGQVMPMLTCALHDTAGFGPSGCKDSEAAPEVSAQQVAK